MIDLRPSGRERRLLGAILALGTIVLFFVAIGLVAQAIFFFGDVLFAFFLAWLLAFIISPLVSRVASDIPGLPRAVATVIVYTIIILVLVFIALIVAQALATSIAQFVASIPQIRHDLPQIVAPLQSWLGSVGLGQVDIVTQIGSVLDNVDKIAAALIVPLQSIAVASVG